MARVVDCYLHSQTGAKQGIVKTNNQDCADFWLSPYTWNWYFWVADGHGESGHHVSESLCNHLNAILQTEPDRPLTEAMLRAEQETLRESVPLSASRSNGFDCVYSGSTLVCGRMSSEALEIANVGDCRVMVIAEASNGDLVSRFATADHKPDLPSERKRLEAAGSEVVCDPCGRPYVSFRDELTGGGAQVLGMSRSMGDMAAHSHGVVSTPDSYSIALEPCDRFILAASDGLWEFISKEKVTEVLSRNKQDAQIAVDELVREGCRLWSEQSGGSYDDTTVVLFRLSRCTSPAKDLIPLYQLPAYNFCMPYLSRK